MLQGETILSGADFKNYSRLQVMKYAAGYYIGTVYHDDGYDCPGSRESDYFKTKEEAQKMLDEWHSTAQVNGPESFYWEQLRFAYMSGSLQHART